MVSRRARLLHHIYAWTRIIAESTHVFRLAVTASSYASHEPLRGYQAGFITEDPTGRYNEASRVPSSHEIKLDDFFRLEPRYLSLNPGSDLRRHNIPVADVSDIHLCGSGQDASNMYMQIYGIPETFLRLVSQVTRLANTMDRYRSEVNKGDAEALTCLQPRATQLENTICTFAIQCRADVPTDVAPGSCSLIEAQPHTEMLQALGSALVIFFYRRVRHSHPLILQSSVDDVITGLQRFDKALARCELKGPGTAWPVFIAGCEAMTHRQKQQIMAWIDAAIEKSGFRSYKVAKKIMVEVWVRRGQRTSPTSQSDNGDFSDVVASNRVTWMEVCRDTRQWPLLC